MWCTGIVWQCTQKVKTICKTSLLSYIHRTPSGNSRLLPLSQYTLLARSLGQRHSLHSPRPLPGGVERLHMRPRVLKGTNIKAPACTRGLWRFRCLTSTVDGRVKTQCSILKWVLLWTLRNFKVKIFLCILYRNKNSRTHKLVCSCLLTKKTFLFGLGHWWAASISWGHISFGKPLR